MCSLTESCIIDSLRLLFAVSLCLMKSSLLGFKYFLQWQSTNFLTCTDVFVVQNQNAYDRKAKLCKELRCMVQDAHTALADLRSRNAEQAFGKALALLENTTPKVIMVMVLMWKPVVKLGLTVKTAPTLHHFGTHNIFSVYATALVLSLMGTPVITKNHPNLEQYHDESFMKQLGPLSCWHMIMKKKWFEKYCSCECFFSFVFSGAWSFHPGCPAVILRACISPDGDWQAWREPYLLIYSSYIDFYSVVIKSKTWMLIWLNFALYYMSGCCVCRC